MPDEDPAGQPRPPARDPVADHLDALKHDIEAGKAAADEIIAASRERAERFDRPPHPERDD